MNTFLRSIVVLIAVIFTGCSSPGAPHIRTNIDDGEGPLISYCKNVSSSTIVNNYITRSYLSTWGSAFLEGASQGSRKNLGQDVLRKVKRRDQLLSSYVEKGVLQENYNLNDSRISIKNGRLNVSINYDELLFPSPPFCRAYNANPLDISRAISAIVSSLGNDFILSDIESGLFITKFVERQHSAAQWVDRYIVTVSSDTSQHTVVKILRELYISRQNGPFNEAISNGHNETWLMTQIAKMVKTQ